MNDIQLSSTRDAIEITFSDGATQSCTTAQPRFLLFFHYTQLRYSPVHVQQQDYNADNILDNATTADSTPFEYANTPCLPPTHKHILHFIYLHFLWRHQQVNMQDDNRANFLNSTHDGGLVHTNGPPSMSVWQETGEELVTRCYSILGKRGDHNTAKISGHAQLTIPANEAEAKRSDPPPSKLRLVAQTPAIKVRLLRGKKSYLISDPWLFRLSRGIRGVNSSSSWKLIEDAGSDARVFARRTRFNGAHGAVTQDPDDNRWKTLAMTRLRQAPLGVSRKNILKAVLAVEGIPASVATYDGPKLSWGMCQWTWMGSAPELLQIVAFIYDYFPTAYQRCFGKYGIGLYFGTVDPKWDPWRTYGRTKKKYRPQLYRIPCCEPTAPVPCLSPELSVAGYTKQTLAAHHAKQLTAVGPQHALKHVKSWLKTWSTVTENDKRIDSLNKRLASEFTLSRHDTTTVAMIYLFHKAGLDNPIIDAQFQWTSFRVTYSKDRSGGQYSMDPASFGYTFADDEKYRKKLSTLDASIAEKKQKIDKIKTRMTEISNSTPNGKEEKATLRAEKKQLKAARVKHSTERRRLIREKARLKHGKAVHDGRAKYPCLRSKKLNNGIALWRFLVSLGASGAGALERFEHGVGGLRTTGIEVSNTSQSSVQPTDVDSWLSGPFQEHDGDYKHWYDWSVRNWHSSQSGSPPTNLSDTEY